MFQGGMIDHNGAMTGCMMDRRGMDVGAMGKGTRMGVAMWVEGTIQIGGGCNGQRCNKLRSSGLGRISDGWMQHKRNGRCNRWRQKGSR